ncbi:3-oxoadipate--succinyl-CoA transferase subunit B [Marmoricola endophyticus]|uniref:3-oxoadipate--succinyl-CoA transferase subunit B n=1 Tax=Marmoricola endophyticus TaxID=2040280 RepID=A0A917BEG0_9ACTN|nr:CoA-transferase [Marmoricola endophyticus]GGF34702.1 3-oxoadipate--succinyl-CoA transferase subunit B [Marmoricola endophyticus]
MTGPLSDVPPASTEFLATVAARELEGKQRVFAGVGLPTLAVDLAVRTLNPDLELVYESGVCGARPEAMAEGIADSVLVSGAAAVVPMPVLFGYVLQRGHVDVGFLGAAQVDRYGSLNTSFIGSWRDGARPDVRLPGAGGAVEVMANAGEVVVVLRRHDPGALPDRLDFCTSPSPVAARAADPRAVPRGFGLRTLITPKAVLRRRDRFGELEVASVHPGVSLEEVRASTGWDVAVSPDVVETRRPRVEDVRLLREEIDIVRLYLR